MKIIGLTLKKILVEQKEAIKGKLEIKAGLSISDIQKEELSLSDKSTLKIDFTYSVDYSPNVALVEIKGSIITIDEKDESKSILADWKDKKIVDSVRIPLFNFIMSKCNIKALQLEDELGLPLHIPMPKLGIKPSDEQDSKSKSKDKKDKEKNPANYAG